MNKKELDESFKIFRALVSAYTLILQISATSTLRTENQGVYAQVRDAIALATGDEPEEVQYQFEEDALKLREDL